MKYNWCGAADITTNLHYSIRMLVLIIAKNDIRGAADRFNVLKHIALGRRYIVEGIYEKRF